MKKIIIIDDSPEDREWLRGLFSAARGYKTHAFERSDAALRHIQQFGADCILLDFKLAEGDNTILAMKSLREVAPDAPVILATGYGAAMLDELAGKFGVSFLPKDGLTRRKAEAAVEATLGVRT